METQTVKLKDIHTADYNPRIALKPGDKEFEDIRKSITKFGVATPLIVNKTTGNLVSGHQRLSVLKEIGVEETEVVLIEADADREKLLNVALNKIEGDWDYDKLEELLREFDADDIQFTGFSAEEISSMFQNEIGSYDFNESLQAAEHDNDEAEWNSEDEDTYGSEKDADRRLTVFLVFSTKEAGEEWGRENSLPVKFNSDRRANIRMGESSCGTGR